jgi:hypothetical protein
MSEYLITEVNCETGKVTEREMTADETKQRAADDAVYAQTKANELAQAQAKTALLAKLGITADEAKLLLS